MRSKGHKARKNKSRFSRIFVKHQTKTSLVLTVHNTTSSNTFHQRKRICQ